MIPLLIAVAIMFTAQQTLTSQERYAKFLDQHNQRLIEQMTEKIAQTQQRLGPLNKQRPRGRDEKKALRQEKIAIHDKIKVLKSDLARLNREKKSKRYTWPKPVLQFGSSLRVGLIGPLFKEYIYKPQKRKKPHRRRPRDRMATVSTNLYAHYAISQIISENEMLVRCEYTSAVQAPPTSQPVLVRGMSTEGMADEQKIYLGGKYFEVTGTYQYQTVLGSMKTVIVLEPFDATGFMP